MICCLWNDTNSDGGIIKSGETSINPAAMKVSPHAMQAVETIMKKGTEDDDMSMTSLETDNKGG